MCSADCPEGAAARTEAAAVAGSGSEQALPLHVVVRLLVEHVALVVLVLLLQVGLIDSLSDPRGGETPTHPGRRGYTGVK